MRVILAAYTLDEADVGESLLGLKLVRELAMRCDMTVLALERDGQRPLQEQLPDARVISWPEPRWPSRFERLNAMMKPAMFGFTSKIRKWVRSAQRDGARFDLAHFLLPSSPRYPVPFYGLGLPYIVGPVGGALPNLPGFKSEMEADSWYVQLRVLDGLRFARDPWLRRSYGAADMVLFVAPYMRDVMRNVPIRRYRSFLGLGLDTVPDRAERHAASNKMELLHVGRAVRSKGLRDVVRALAQLPDLPDVRLTSIGGGNEIAVCRAEAERLGVADRVRFLGRIPRHEVDEYFRSCDAFVFPSFRESMGIVLYEAMSWGLPIITASAGGPDWIVDDRCGLKVDPTTPEQLSTDLASAIRTLASDGDMRLALGAAGRNKVLDEGLWPRKADVMMSIYQDVLATQAAPHASHQRSRAASRGPVA